MNLRLLKDNYNLKRLQIDKIIRSVLRPFAVYLIAIVGRCMMA